MTVPPSPRCGSCPLHETQKALDPMSCEGRSTCPISATHNVIDGRIQAGNGIARAVRVLRSTPAIVRSRLSIAPRSDVARGPRGHLDRLPASLKRKPDMPLPVGHRLGVYEIAGALGAGGM